MPLEKKGKEILKEVKYPKVRNAIIGSIMERISKEGMLGSDVRPIIEETLREEHFTDFIEKLIQEIRRKTNMSASESAKSVPYLIEEDVSQEVLRNMEGKMEEIEKPFSEKEERELHEKGEREKLWKKIGRQRLLGKKPLFLLEVWQILSRHLILRVTIISGISLLIISAFLFHSLYKAVLVGLTLTAFTGNSILIKVANLAGGTGGILIFFTSISLFLQYFIIVRSRDEEIREIARRYLEKKGYAHKF